MSDIGAISSSQPSLIDEITNAPDTISDPAYQSVESSTSIDELQDKLKIIETANQGQNANLVNSVSTIQNMIENNASLDEIKSSLLNQ